jgi:diacylglycerol kinase (ATP)
MPFITFTKSNFQVLHRYFLYIINPIAGTRAKKDLQVFIEKETTTKGIPFQVFPSVASGDYSFLFPFIEEKKVTDIIIAGGDGTVSQVVYAFMRYKPNFGIIPCGSGNGLAFAAGIPKNPAKALAIIFAGKAAAIDGYYINNQFACMLTGLGFDAKVAHDFANQPKRGLATYVKETIKNFIKAKTYTFGIKANDQHFSIDAFFISIANSNQFGNHFTIAPKASLSDGLLDIVIVTKQSKLSMIIKTMAQVRGKNKLQTGGVQIDKKGVVYFQCATITVHNKDEAPMHIDGEPVHTAARVEVKVAEKCFKLLQTV